MAVDVPHRDNSLTLGEVPGGAEDKLFRNDPVGHNMLLVINIPKKQVQCRRQLLINLLRGLQQNFHKRHPPSNK